MTTGPSYERVFERLRQAIPAWDDLPGMSTSDLADVIADAGLVNQKAPRFIAIARKLKDDFGRVTLSPLASCDDQDVEAYLTTLPGVGIKTAKCVMMYAMDRSVLPIDTHVARIATRLGLLDPEVPVGRRHDLLEAVVAPVHRYDFHVNAIAHGRAVCRAQAPRCIDCPIATMCPAGRGTAYLPAQVTQVSAAS